MLLPKSIIRTMKRNPNLETAIRGLPDLGKRQDGTCYSKEVEKIYKSFGIYGNGLYELLTDSNRDLPTKSMGGGSPMKTKPFPLCQKEMIEMISSQDLSEYPLAAGDEKDREKIVEYLIKEGFKSDGGITKDNVIFTISTTHAFNIICKIIARPHDVIIMTGPNYGLFTFIPERSNSVDVEILPLSQDDDWYVNPHKLEQKIIEINNHLKKKYKKKINYTPKVVAFLNENPHNPLGKVMSKKNKHILEEIGEVCFKNGVFVIDDLIYRDLTYDKENLAIPLGTYKKYFDNTISLFGLSKCYGLASVRAGMIIANPVIIRGVRNFIFQTMDSSPTLQSKALVGAFNASKEREIEYKKYFDQIINEYKYRFLLLKALIEGISSIDNYILRREIRDDIIRFLSHGTNKELILEGIPGLKIVFGTEPEAGFFVMIDFSNLKGKEANGRKIENEIELLKYLYETEKIKFILGQSISWPYEDQLVGRVTIALEREDIVKYMEAMNRTLRKLR